MREQVIADVEAHRHQHGEPGLEKELSINDWIDRLQGAAKQAHLQARAGDDQGQYDTWVELASTCVGRAEQLAELLS